MDWMQILVLLATNWAIVLPLWLWNRSEARADIRHMDAKIDENRKETNILIKAIHEEMKDFHVRLIALESKKGSK